MSALYTYGEGNQIVEVTTQDNVFIENATMSDIRGIKAEDGRTAIVFNNYDVLNIYGTPANLILDGVTLDRAIYDNGLYVEPTDSSNLYTYGSGIKAISVDVLDNVYIENITKDQIREIDIASGRTTIVFDDNNALTIFGTPANLVINQEQIEREAYDNGVYAEPGSSETDTSIYVYDYGEGNNILFVDTNDYVFIENATTTQIKDVKTEDGRTTIVFDNYDTLNIYGTPASLIVDGVTLDRAIYDNGLYVEPTATYDNSFSGTIQVYNEGDGDDVIVANSYEWVDLRVDADRVRGVKTDSDRAVFVLDDYTAINVFGVPKAYTVGDKIFSTDASGELNYEGQVGSGNWQWGTSEADYFTYNYGGGNETFVVDSNDSVGIIISDFSQLVGVSTKENSAVFMFDNYQTLSVEGRASTYFINNNLYYTNADGSLHYEDTLTDGTTDNTQE